MNTIQKLISRNVQSVVVREANKYFDAIQNADSENERRELIESRERIETAWSRVSRAIRENDNLDAMIDAIKAIENETYEDDFVIIEARQQIRWAQGE